MASRQGPSPKWVWSVQSHLRVTHVMATWLHNTHNYPSSLTWIYPGMVLSISPPWRPPWVTWWWAPASPGPAPPRPSSSCPRIRWGRQALIAQYNVVTSQDGFSLTKGDVSWVGSLMPVGALIGQCQPPGIVTTDPPVAGGQVGGLFMSRFGRKGGMMVASVMFRWNSNPLRAQYQCDAMLQPLPPSAGRGR